MIYFFTSFTEPTALCLKAQKEIKIKMQYPNAMPRLSLQDVSIKSLKVQPDNIFQIVNHFYHRERFYHY